jgi:FemAB-related protein (PEP-CTERM system-associated)
VTAELSEAWDDFVRAHAFGTVFHLRAWQRLIEGAFGHTPVHLVASEGPSGRIAGLLPLFLVHSRIFGRMLISTPQAAYGGIIADSQETADNLLGHAQEMARHFGVRFLELRSFQNDLADTSLPVKDLYVTFRKELDPDVEKNFLSIPRKTRAEARHGIQAGLELGVDAISVDEFYRIYAESVRDLGTPVFSRNLLCLGQGIFGSDCRIFSVHWEGRPVAAVWTLFYKNEVIPYYGGSLRKYSHLGINNFMYWMLIRHGCENGYRIFDFGRSKRGTGSFDFKKRWGMTMMDLPYQYVLVRDNLLPDTSPLNPKFSLPIQIWRRLPLFITNSLGPHISKHLI